MSLPLSDRKNILVTGGAGFIGSFLCEALVQTANVICVDNFSTGSQSNLHDLLQNPHFELINQDINQPLDLLAFPELERFQVRVHGIQEIYHLACPISKRNFQEFRIATLQTNSIGWRHVLELASSYQAKVLLASTSALYDAQDSSFLAEDDRCWADHLGPHGAYDESKRFAETMGQTYAEIYGFPLRIARIFRTYGPRMKINEGNLLPDIVNAALSEQDQILTFSEDARLGLCYVSDMVDGLIKLMDASVDVRVMNLGSDHEVRLATFVERVLQITGSSARVQFQPDQMVPWQEPALPNIDKARQVLHWLPLVRLEDGLKKMIAYARSERQRTSPF